MGKFFMDLDDGDIGFAFDEFGVNSPRRPCGEQRLPLGGAVREAA